MNSLMSLDPIQAGSLILFTLGFVLLLLDQNLIKKIIGMNIMDTSVFLLFITLGYIDGRDAPIITGTFKGVNGYVNPIPTGLMLTGIVVAVSTTAVMLGLTIQLHRIYGTIELNEILQLRREGRS